MKQQYQVGDYRETYRTFQLKTPHRFNWAFEVFDKWAKDPDKLAMLWVSPNGKPREVTYREFSERSRQVANALSALGLKPGDRVFIMLPRLVEWWEIMLACIRASIVSVPGTTLLTPRDIEYRVNASGAKIVITDTENVSKVDTVLEKCQSIEKVVVVGKSREHIEYEELVESSSSKLSNPNNLATDPMVIYFTSGTTGYPKMVLNNHSNYPIGHIATGKLWMDNRPSDIHWTISDTGWAQAAWTCFFAPWNMGAAIFIWDQRGRFEARAVLDMIERFPITTFFAPPTAYRMLVLEDLDSFKPKALRHCIGAGEPVNPEVIQMWRQGTGHHIWECYGQTETTIVVATFPGMEYRPGSMGVAAPGYHVAIVDQEGKELPPHSEGEIAIRTNPDRPVGLFPGYWRNPEANAKCFRGDWYFTGDRATRDEDGYFWFVGRADDVIISASYRIGPTEVESAMIEHKAVAEVAVVGRADQIRGTIVKAFVVLAPNYKPSDELIIQLQDHVKTTTAPYKYPREIQFMNDLPKTISGKIRRNELRRLDLEQSSTGFDT
jgi:acetyl-CoA synthetase/medium-chain acyl-CoA synthetase